MRMQRQQAKRIFWISAVILIWGLAILQYSFGQAINRTQQDITCPVTGGGGSIQVLSGNSNRLGWSFVVTGSAAIRFAYIAGSAVPVLDGTNSQQVNANGTYSESFPTVWIGRIVCQSTTASTSIISVTEIRR